MPNFLEMCQDVHRLAGVQGTFISVLEAGINGEIAKLVSRAWADVQELRNNFEFRRKIATFSMAVGTASYTPTTIFAGASNDDLGRWKTDPKSLYITDPSSGEESEVFFVESYDVLRDRQKNSAVNDKPRFWSYAPADLSLFFHPKPNLIYQANADYYRTVQVLAGNADTPYIRSMWHDIIVYKALSAFGVSKGLQGLHQKYEIEYAKRAGALLREFVPSTSVFIVPAA